MSKRLLILVEDEWVTSRALVLDLTEAGYFVETAEDDREVVRKARSRSYDLLIAADPRGGESAGRVIDRFREERPEAKVVLMTTEGGSRSGPVDSGDESDRVTRIRKPFDLDTIRTVVDGLLESGRATSGNAT
ncbi:MAG: hypothetical protein GY741_14395 [Phycisphaeraceae bacterium]|nr:hypothetical protein [Phycisphaeraceae bacterium]